MTQATPDEPEGSGNAESEPIVGGTDKSSRPIWPKKRLNVTRAQRVGDSVVTTLTRRGLVPNTYVLTTVGRKTGKPRSTPVTVVRKGDKRWLVAPYGPVSWVLNARAAGQVSLSRRGHAQNYTITELDPEGAGPILKDYVKIAGATRTYFEATKNSPVADFTAEASRHPVFELTLITDPRG